MINTVRHDYWQKTETEIFFPLHLKEKQKMLGQLDMDHNFITSYKTIL